MAKITVNYPDKHAELLKLLLEKTNGDLDLIFRETTARFVRSNLDLLSDEELKEFDSILFIKPKERLKNDKKTPVSLPKKGKEKFELIAA
jgi:succinate dehydrogenase flavin-adding protein (antitoxin of CptAB toxin-antitoxin module)